MRTVANSILWFCRIFVGVLFIFSGLIKANDPVGFGIKLDEYYEVFADKWPWTSFIFSSEWLLNTTAIQAAFLTTLEVALGIALILGVMRNLVAWLLLLLTIFFTWLTGFSAITNTVTDCGCFGDAIPLTPWQSFYKDIILLLLILIIFAARRFIKPLFNAAPSFIIFILVSGFALWVAMRSITHDVFIDFRPYAVGNNIPELMQIPADARQPVIEMVYLYQHKSNNKKKEIRIGNTANDKNAMNELSAITNDSMWEFIERKDKIVEQGFVPEISDFAIMDENGNDITTGILTNADYQLMIVVPDFKKTKKEGWEKVNVLQKEAENEGIFAFALAGESGDEINKFRHNYQAAFPFYTGDKKVCLTIVRTNPGVVLLKNGTVIDKWSWRDLPSYAEIKNEHFDNRQPKQLTPITNEFFGEGANVAEKILNSATPYNEFFLADMDGNDVTTQRINDSITTYMVIVNDMTKLTMETWNVLLPLMQQLDSAQADYFVVSSSEGEMVQGMKDASKLSFNYYTSDGEVLSKIINENTGIVVIQKGAVVKKYSEINLQEGSNLLIQ